MPSKQSRDLAHIREQGVVHISKARDRAFAGVVIAGPARIFNHDRDVPEICSLPNGRLDSDFQCNTHNHKNANAAITERSVERGALEGRHADLVEYRLGIAGCELGHAA